MDSLRASLDKISGSIPHFSTPSTQTRLAIVSQTHLAVLHPSPPSLNLHPLTPSHAPSNHSIPEDANTLYSAKDMLAITGPRSLTVLHNPTRPRLHPVAEALFRTRPSLKVLHAAWSPHAHAFLAVLTSDSCLRLFDVVTPRTSATERWRFPLATAGAAPVSFAFGRGSKWNSLSVYILCEDGAIYVCAPVAPIGTTLPTASWQTMRTSAVAVVQRHTGPESVNNIEHDQNTAWAVRQAAMQIRFLDTFEPNQDRMICVREFKPAPLLLQGPLHVEHDDVVEDINYVDLTVLVCGAAPSVLLRVSERGEVSVLVSLERVEPQWFLSANVDGVGSTEYAETARTVAPSVLAFEHLSFNAPISLIPLGGSPDADVLFAATKKGVFSIRLSFIAVITNADTLERTPHSTVSQMLTTSTAEGEGNMVCGLAPSYARNAGPIGIVLTSEGGLHTTPPLRWVADFDLSLPPRLLTSPQSDAAWNVERPLRGSRAYACPDAGKDVSEFLHAVATLQGKHLSRVAPGTLGKVEGNEKLSSAISFLESSVDGFTGGSHGAGIVDCLSNLASVVTQWRDELQEHAISNTEELVDIENALQQVGSSECALKHKLMRVEELASLLAERMRTVVETIRSDSSQLSPAEAERWRRLKEKKRKMASLRQRVEELSAAVKANTEPRQEDRGGSLFSTPNARHLTPVRSPGFRSPSLTPRRSNRWSTSPMWKQDDLLSRRRSERSPRGDVPPLSWKELEQIKVSLEAHSREISEAMELSSSLWKRLSVV